MDFDALLEQLSDFCQAASAEDAPEEMPSKLDMGEVWNTLMKIEKSDENSVHAVLPLLSLYVAKVNDARVEVPVCGEKLEALKNEKNTFEERFEAGLPLIRFAPLLCESQVLALIEGLIDLFDMYGKTNPAILPADLIESIDDFCLEDLEPETTVKIVKMIQDQVATEKKLGALMMLGCHAQEVLELELPDFQTFVMNTIEGTLKEQAETPEADKALKVAALFVFGQASLHWGGCCGGCCGHDHDDEEEGHPAPEALFELLAPFMAIEDVLICKHAHKVFNSLISVGLFNEEKFAADHIARFAQYSEKNMKYFFKVLSTFVYPTEDDECGCDDCDDEEGDCKMEVIQVIVDWITEQFENKDAVTPLVLSLCLDLLGDLACKEKMYAEDLVEKAIAIAGMLIEKQFVAGYEYISNFLIAMSENFEDLAAQIRPLIDPIVAALDKEELGDLKHRIYCASAIAQIVADSHDKKHVDALCAFILNALSQDDEKIAFTVSSVAMPLKASYNEEQANAIFAKLAKWCMDCINDEYVATWAHTMAKILKRNTINADALKEFIDAIMNGTLKSLHGKPPHKCIPPNSALFGFLACYIKKFAGSAKSIVEQVIEWIGFTPFPSIPALAVTLRAAASVGVIDAELAGKVVPILKGILTKLDTKDCEELGAVVSVLTEIYAHQPASLAPVSEIVNLLGKFVEAVSMDDEEEEMMCMESVALIECMPFVAQLVFSICASIDDPAAENINEDVLVGLVELLPFPAEVEEMGDLISQLCAMLENPDGYECILVPALKIIVELLLLKKSELEEYNFPDELIKEMKAAVKNNCAKNKKLQNRVTEDFKGTRAKVNRFNALLR